MNKLALSDDILMQLDKPARYIGNELNMVRKDPSKVDIRFAMCFPDVYEIGMSHLGIQILYEMFNRRDDVYCERVYSPWPDLHKIMKEEDIPLFALETQDPIKDFDFVGITLLYQYPADLRPCPDPFVAERPFGSGSDHFMRRTLYLQSGADC